MKEISQRVVERTQVKVDGKPKANATKAGSMNRAELEETKTRLHDNSVELRRAMSNQDHERLPQLQSEVITDIKLLSQVSQDVGTVEAIHKSALICSGFGEILDFGGLEPIEIGAATHQQLIDPNNYEALFGDDPGFDQKADSSLKKVGISVLEGLKNIDSRESLESLYALSEQIVSQNVREIGEVLTETFDFTEGHGESYYTLFFNREADLALHNLTPIIRDIDFRQYGIDTSSMLHSIETALKYEEHVQENGGPLFPYEDLRTIKQNNS